MYAHFNMKRRFKVEICGDVACRSGCGNGGKIMIILDQSCEQVIDIKRYIASKYLLGLDASDIILSIGGYNICDFESCDAIDIDDILQIRAISNGADADSNTQTLVKRKTSNSRGDSDLCVTHKKKKKKQTVVEEPVEEPSAKHASKSSKMMEKKSYDDINLPKKKIDITPKNGSASHYADTSPVIDPASVWKQVREPTLSITPSPTPYSKAVPPSAAVLGDICTSDSTVKKKKRKRKKGSTVGVRLNEQYSTIDMISPFGAVECAPTDREAGTSVNDTGSLMQRSEYCEEIAPSNTNSNMPDLAVSTVDAPPFAFPAPCQSNVDITVLEKILRCPQITLFPVVVENGDEIAIKTISLDNAQMCPVISENFSVGLVIDAMKDADGHSVGFYWKHLYDVNESTGITDKYPSHANAINCNASTDITDVEDCDGSVDGMTLDGVLSNPGALPINKGTPMEWEELVELRFLWSKRYSLMSMLLD